MAERIIDLETWPRASQFWHFRTYDRPHYATTARVDVTKVIAQKPNGVSPYRASLYAIGSGLNAAPELRMRFQGDVVTEYDRLSLSMPVPTESGSFAYGYVPWCADFARFDADCAAELAAKAKATDLDPNHAGEGAVAYVSCMPWMDYTALNNAMPGPDDCIPRVGWGKIVDHGGRWDMAMTLEVHHALVDGAHVGAFFDAVQAALDRF